MVNDKEVKTVVSPFAVRENEVKVFDGKEGFASINQVVFKMDMGYITTTVKVLDPMSEDRKTLRYSLLYSLKEIYLYKLLVYVV